MNQLIKKIKDKKDTSFALDYAFTKLAEGVKNRKSHLHLLNLGTVSKDGKPQTRTIVLRYFDSERKIIRFHTDMRSKKIDEIKNNNSISLLGYDNIDKLQIRMECEAKINYSEDFLSDIWSKMNINSKECYSIKKPPGSIINAPQDIDFYSRNIIPKSFENFIVVICNIKNIDLLYLHNEGHIRANYRLINKQFVGNWVIP